MGTDVSVVVTGTGWMGSGTGSIEAALEEIFRQANREVILIAYSLTLGADRVFDWIEQALARGITVRAVINRLETQPAEIVLLRRLALSYGHLQLHEFVGDEETDLHAKAFVADRKVALVSSSNISRRGILANHELAVRLIGDAAEEIALAFDRLLNSRFVSPVRLTGSLS